MKPRGRAAAFARISVLVALLVALSAGVIALRRAVDARMGAVRDSLLGSLQLRLGRSISFGQVSPSVFRELAVTDLKVFSAGDPGRVVLSVDRVRASYSLIRLLLTRDPLEALREINLSGSVLTLDERADGELLKSLASLVREPPAPGGGARFLAPPALRVTGSDLSVRLMSRGAEIGVSRLQFSIAGGEKWISVALRCGLSGELEGRGLLAGSFRTGLALSGKAARDLAWADLELDLRSFEHDRLALRDQTFLLGYRDGIVELTKIEDRAPVDLTLTIGTESRLARLDFRAEGLRPSELFTLRGDWAPAMPWLAGPVSARGSLSVGLDGGRLSYEVELATEFAAAPLPAPVSVRARLSGDEALLVVESLEADSAVGSVSFAGDVELAGFLPDGLATVRGMESLLGRRIAGSLTIQRGPPRAGRPRTLHVASSALQFGSLALRGLSADLAMERGTATVSLTAAALPWPGAAQMPSASFSGSVSWEPAPRIELAGTVQAVSLGAVAAALSPEQRSALGPRLGAMTASGAVRVVTDLKSYSVDVESAAIVDPSDPANRASGTFSVTNRRLSVRGLDLAYLGQRVAGEADVEFASGRPVGFRSSVRLNDVPFDVSGSLEANDLRFAGSYGIEGAVAIFPFETDRRDVYFWIKSASMPVPVAGLPMTARLDLKGAFPDGEEWFVTSTGSRASFRMPDSGASVEAEMDFVLNRRGVTFERLSVADPVSAVSGTGTVTFEDLSRPSVALGFRLRSPKTTEQYAIQGSVSPDKLEVRADIAGSPVAHLGQTVVSGYLRGSAKIEGSLRSPELTASLSLESGRFNRDPIALAADLSSSSDAVMLRNVSFSMGDHRVTDGRASLDLRSGRFSLGARYDALLLSDRVRVRVGASGEVAGYSLADIAALAFPDSMRATLTVSEATVDGVPYPPWSVEFASDGSTLSFAGGPGGMLRGSLGRDHRISGRIGPPFPLVGSIDGTLEGGRIDAALAVERLDIPVLSTLLDTDMVQFTAGSAAGSLTIYGPLNDPDIVGTLRVSGASVSSPLSPDAVTDVNTFVSFGPGGADEEEKVFVLDSVTAPAGKGKVSAAARFTMDHWVPTAFDLRLTAEPPDGVHLVWRFGTLAVDGYARGTVRVTQEGARTEVSSSDLVVQSARLELDYSEPEEEPGGPGESSLGVKVRVTTGRNVQFLWPAQAFPILKATARQGSVVDVRYDDEADELIMAGDVSVLGGTLFFFDRSFSIREGSITFQENKLQFDPRISVRAEIRERDEKNQDYRITLEADRVRLSQFSTETIRFSSDPALPSAVIRERIGESIFARTASPGSPEGTAALPLFASLTGDVISQVGLLSPVEDRVRDALGLDLVSIRTQVVQNFLVDKILSQASGLDNDGPALGKYFGNTELTVGKYIGDDLFLSMMLRLQTADAEGRAGMVGLTGLRPAFEISIEWETPFFVLDWSFLPRHPESLFLRDNTLGFRWRIRY